MKEGAHRWAAAPEILRRLKTTLPASDMASLLSLPFEVRLKILEYAITDKALLICLGRRCILHYCFGPFKPLNRNANLMLICNKINDELKLRLMPNFKLFCCSETTAKKYMEIYRPRLDKLEYLRLPTTALWYPQGEEDRDLHMAACASSAPELSCLSLVQVEELPSDVPQCVRFTLRYEPQGGINLRNGG